MKVVVLGLDCAEPDLVFDRLSARLPNLSALRATAAWGRLRSVDPPITVPAWACMATGEDPGALGIYGFRNREAGSYDLRVVTNRAVPPRALWDRVEAAGGRACVLGVPPMYPPRPLARGATFGCFLTPGPDAAFAHPPALAAEARAKFGPYLPDAEGFRTDDKGALRERILAAMRQRWDMAEWLWREKGPWDLFWMVDMGIDRVHHGFWRFFDETHPKFEDGPWRGVIPEIYEEADRRAGRMMTLAGIEPALLVVSDHGIQPMEGGIAINDWLRREGFLRMKSEPVAPRKFRVADVDWTRTRAWGEGGYYGRVFLNLRGRDPEGIVPPEDAATLLADLARGLAAAAPDTRVLRPSEIYPRVEGFPSDLLVYFSNLRRRSVGTVGNPRIEVEENDTGPDEANHDFDGIYLYRGPGAAPGRADRSLLEIAPLLRGALGL